MPAKKNTSYKKDAKATTSFLRPHCHTHHHRDFQQNLRRKNANEKKKHFIKIYTRHYKFATPAPLHSSPQTFCSKF